jgi:hypothetical protein
MVSELQRFRAAFAQQDGDRMTRLHRILITLLICLACAQAQQPSSNSLLDWKQFRSQHNFHIQTLAASAPHADGSRTLIISEPPPHVTLDHLRRLAPALGNVSVMTHTIGHGGWVKDLVVTVPAQNEQQWRDLTSLLNQYLFFTTYKATVLSLTPPANKHSYKLDVNVPAVVLGQWIQGGDATFVPLLGGSHKLLKDIIQRDDAGVFFSNRPGLVLWIFPKSENLRNFQVQGREFVLDSDLILGGFSAGGSVVVIGRERVVPIDQLPPLRVETILQLASVGSDELAQSYERTNFLAGKFDQTTNADWAPIYLSQQLIDTEYGSLLNITDQLLKGWSLNGTVRYENFDYPQPAQWPFSAPIMDLLKVPVLTFNWNTKGVGYVVDAKGQDTFAIFRTGALPVSYIPEGHAAYKDLSDSVSEKEDRAYSYFAELNDPNLVRVVQYAALYQLFRRFNVQGTSPWPAAPAPATSPVPTVVEMLKVFSGLDEEQIKSNLKGLRAKKELTDLELLEALDSLDHLEEVQEMVLEVQKQWGDAGMVHLAELLVNPRAADPDAGLDDRLRAKLKALPSSQRAAALKALQNPVTLLAGGAHSAGILAGISEADRKHLALHAVADELTEHRSLVRAVSGYSVGTLKTDYETANITASSGWIHTPAVVVSYGNEAMASGGHNLDARVSEFKADPTVPRGKVRVQSEADHKIVRYNPDDNAVPRELSPAMAEVSDIPAAQVEKMLNELMPYLPRPQPVVRETRLGFTATEKPNINRGFQPEHAPSRFASAGFRTNAHALSPQDVDFAQATSKAPTTIIERKSLTSIVITRGDSAQYIEATDMTGTMDVLSQIINADQRQGQRSMLLFREGFSRDEADGLAQALRVKNEAAPPDVIVDMEGSSAEQIRTILRDGEFHPRDAKIVEVSEVETTPDGGKAVDVVTEIKNTSRTSSVLFKIRLLFRNVVESVSNLREMASSAVQEVLARLSTQQQTWNAQRIASETNRALEKRFGAGTVQVTLQQSKAYAIVELFTNHVAS